MIAKSPKVKNEKNEKEKKKAEKQEKKTRMRGKETTEDNRVLDKVYRYDSI